MILNVRFFMVNNVGHTIKDEINTQNIGDHIVGAHYTFQPTLCYI